MHFQIHLHLLCILIELFTDRQDSYLIRSQPQRELTGSVFNQYSHKTFHWSEWCTVNHHRTVLLVVRAHIFQFKTFRQVIVYLNGSQLPTAADGIFHHKVELGTIESSFTVLNLSRQAFFLASLDNRLFSFLPVVIATDVFFTVHFITEWYLSLEILEIHRTEHDRNDIHHTEELIFHLIRTTENMCVILSKAAYTS